MSSSQTLLPTNITPQPFVFFPGNSVPVMWSLTFGASWSSGNPQPLIDGVGTFTILDSQGNPVAGADALVFTPTSTPGQYVAQLDGSAFNPPLGAGYKSIITFTSPSIGGPSKWTISTVVRLRTSP